MKQGDLNLLLWTRKSQHLKLSKCRHYLLQIQFPSLHPDFPKNQSPLICPLARWHETCSFPLSSGYLLSQFSPHLTDIPSYSSSQASHLSSLTPKLPLTLDKVPHGADTHSQGVTSPSPVFIPPAQLASDCHIHMFRSLLTAPLNGPTAT